MSPAEEEPIAAQLHAFQLIVTGQLATILARLEQALAVIPKVEAHETAIVELRGELAAIRAASGATTASWDRWFARIGVVAATLIGIAALLYH